MTPFRLAEIALASWYLAYAITSTHGPGGVFEWVREHVWHGRHGAPTYAQGVLPDGTPYETPKIYPENGLLDCIICSAPWIALALWLVPDGVIVWALAAAGAALLAHGYAGWRYTQ